MATKLLIAGASNSGKTTLLSSLKDVLVISHDGKNYPFPQPHVNVPTFASAAEFIQLITDKVKAYKAKFGALPATVVIDSVSKVFDTILDNCNQKHTGFKIYNEMSREINEFTSFTQNKLVAAGMNVVIISHAIWDPDTAQYNLVGKGDFSKRGGYLAETDHSIFIETKNGKRIIHHRSTKFPARTTMSELPDSQTVETYNLQEHIDALNKLQDTVSDYAL